MSSYFETEILSIKTYSINLITINSLSNPLVENTLCDTKNIKFFSTTGWPKCMNVICEVESVTMVITDGNSFVR